ncbi:MAG TPA: hypothetical protein DHV28_13685 [Ignavibacteriales bacterium]|nr:hypothetical protein [Ignavibacteriales bacterium]
MNENIKKEVAERLSEFIKKEFGSVAEASRRLQIPEGTLRYAYLNAKSLPGFEVMYQLLNKGCDLKWLITGKKNYINFNNEQLKDRIDYYIKILRKKYEITEEDLDEDIMTKESERGLFTERLDVRYLLNSWYKKQSLHPASFIDLARLTNVSLTLLLCGHDGPEKEYIDGFLLSYPEIELVHKLKNNPALFKKVKAYIDSKLNEDEIDNIETKK